MRIRTMIFLLVLSVALGLGLEHVWWRHLNHVAPLTSHTVGTLCQLLAFVAVTMGIVFHGFVKDLRYMYTARAMVRVRSR